MQLASIALDTSRIPAGWSPGTVTPSTSTRAPGLLRGALDAWRGVPERSEGVPLTTTQVAVLTPFLARETSLDEAVVRRDLEAVRIHVGGLAHGNGNVATTIGPNIYVSDAAYATRMLSWNGRRWLTHELMHTMQWRLTGAEHAFDGARDRAFLNRYLGSFVASEGRIGAGGFGQALKEIVRRQRAGEPIGRVSDVLHDMHPMEHHAETVALRFIAERP